MITAPRSFGTAPLRIPKSESLNTPLFFQPFHGSSSAPYRTDHVHFTGASPAADIDKEKQRLEQLSSPDKRWIEEKTIPARAEYNVTKNRDVLNKYLPYRQQLVQRKDNAALQRYDALVDKIMEKAEFYQVQDYRPIDGKLKDIYIKPKFKIPFITEAYSKAKYFLTRGLMALSRTYALHVYDSGMKKIAFIGRQVPDEQFKKLLGDTTQPLNDPSTQYIVAAGIADLLYKHPDYIDSAFNGRNKPVRFILADQALTSGHNLSGGNLIIMEKPVIWCRIDAKKDHIAQHEFIHLLSEDANMTSLPFMKKSQQVEYENVRDDLEKMYRKNDHYRIFSELQPSIHNITSTGLRQYVFKNKAEFLAETIDAFKNKPKALCKTEPGKKLYALYKELFGLDPLNDFPH